MAEKLVCPICGEPTRVYMSNARKDRLCAKHADELKAGTLIRNEDGTYSGKSVNISNNTQNTRKCIICGKEAPKGSLCYECWNEMIAHKDTFDKNATSQEMMEHYYNIRNKIYQMDSLDHIKTNCCRLIALANIHKDIYNNGALFDRVDKDVIAIFEKKNNHITEKPTQETLIKDARKEEFIRTTDGHYVRSHPEEVIDNLLYNCRIVHSYEQRIPLNLGERTLICDWYIPVLSETQGIYIEYWGMKTQKYLISKEERIATYKKFGIPLVEIEKDAYRDTQTLKYDLIQKINELAEKHFRIQKYINPFHN